MSDEIECAYCGMDVVDMPVPAAWDDEDWEEEAKRHTERCEWVLTRAHTRPHPDENTTDEAEEP